MWTPCTLWWSQGATMPTRPHAMLPGASDTSTSPTRMAMSSASPDLYRNSHYQGEILKGAITMKIVDAQIHLWAKGKPSAHHRQTPYLMVEELADMDAAGIDRAVIHPVMWDPD